MTDDLYCPRCGGLLNADNPGELLFLHTEEDENGNPVRDWLTEWFTCLNGHKVVAWWRDDVRADFNIDAYPLNEMTVLDPDEPA